MMTPLPFDRAGTGIPLVFLHAFPLSRRMWESQRPVFSRNFQFLSFDFPGFGDSTEAVDVLAMDAAARRVLDSLSALAVSEPAIFVGLSMGGYVLLQLLRIAPERVRAVVFVSTRSSADSDEGRVKRMQTVEAISREGLAPFAKSMVGSLFGASSRAAGLPLIDEVRGWIEASRPGAVSAALRGMAARPDTTAVLTEFASPALFVAGAEDTVIPSAEMESLSKRLRRAEFHSIPSAGHLLNLEQPEKFRDIVLHFLKRHVL